MQVNPESIKRKLEEVGGKGLRGLYPNTRYSRTGTKTVGDNFPCFGARIEKAWRHDARRYLLAHWTLSGCKPACLFKSLVICQRTRRKGEEEHITTHLAGMCPHTTYVFRPDIEAKRLEMLND
jgi:hypothetical protein